MQGEVFIKDDETLQQMLFLMSYIPDAIKINDRVFCEVPVADYNAKLDSEIGDGRKTMSTVYHAYHETDEKVYVLVGEDDGYGEDATGSRDLVNNPVTKEEFIAWIKLYGVASFHVDFPRIEVPI